jgi:hypothetical protein
VNLWVWAVESPRCCGLQREGSLLTSPGALSMHPPRQAALKLGQPFFKRLDGVGDCVGDRNRVVRRHRQRRLRDRPAIIQGNGRGPGGRIRRGVRTSIDRPDASSSAPFGWPASGKAAADISASGEGRASQAANPLTGPELHCGGTTGGQESGSNRGRRGSHVGARRFCSPETVRRWVNHSGPIIATDMCKLRLRPARKEPVAKIAKALKRTEGATRQKATVIGLSLKTCAPEASIGKEGMRQSKSRSRRLLSQPRYQTFAAPLPYLAVAGRG